MKIVGGKWSNWSGGVVCKPSRIVAPKDDVELAAAIRNAKGTVRAPGTGHSFTPLCASNDTLLDLAAFSGLKSVDTDRHVATLAAATPLWAVGPVLHPHGVALANMGDIDRQTLGGVIGTGTHGTGAALGSLSAQVAGFRLILANGDLLNCSATENVEIFAAGRVSMGMLGIMDEISMHVVPSYKLAEKNFALPAGDLFAQIDTLIAGNRHFEFFRFPYAETAICKTLEPSDAPAPAPRSAEKLRARGEAVGMDTYIFAGINAVLPYAPFLLKPAHRLFSRLMPGPERVRWSFEAFPSPRNVRFNEMEYAVPREKGPDCLREIVDAIRRKRIGTGFPIEYRTVAADDIWLSPFYKRDSATIAVHQHYRVDTAELFETCEAIFRRYGGRPHWGKRHSLTARELAELYPEFDRFRALRRELDPGAKFLNPYLQNIFD